MTTPEPSPDNELHQQPLADRITCAAIHAWLTTATTTALASRGTVGCEPAETNAIEEMRHLHLADYPYTVVPQILHQLRHAGLLTPPESP